MNTALNHVRRLREAIARPRTYVAWYGERFAVFLTTEPVAEVKRRFVAMGGIGDVEPSDVQTQHVRVREIPVLGHRITNSIARIVKDGVLFVSWKYGVSGKVYGWDTTARDDAVRWWLIGGDVR